MPTLYKYRPFSARARKILVNREVYFASSEQLNDPYDCRISIRQALRDAVEAAAWAESRTLRETLERFQKIDHVYERMEEDIRNAGVFSLAKHPTNAVMWAHYAENHRGFCIGFDLSEKFTTHRNAEQIIGTDDVRYTKTNPFKDYFEEVAAARQPPTWEEFFPALLSRGMVAKAAAWGYEEEVRVLRKNSGTVSFSPAEVVEIVFGLNMASENRATIRHLLSGDQWRHVHFREIVRVEGFAIDIQDG